VPYDFPASIRRRYERLRQFPDGLLVVGDALCSFNPVYGQGMSVAALEALALRGCLARGDQPLAQRFYRQAARIIDSPWEIVAGDLRFPQAEGRRTPARRLANAYLLWLYPAAERDPVLSNAFFRVTGLLERPQSLLRPGIAWRVLRGSLRRPGRMAAPTQAMPPLTVERKRITQ